MQSTLRSILKQRVNPIIVLQRVASISILVFALLYNSYNVLIEARGGYQHGNIVELLINIIVLLCLLCLTIGIAIYGTKQIGYLQKERHGVLDSIKESVITTDKSGMIVSGSSATEMLFGYTLEELVGKPIVLLLTEEQTNTINSVISQVTNTYHHVVLGTGQTLRIKGKNGRITQVEIDVSHFVIRNERFYTFVVRDVTEEFNNKKTILQQKKLYDSVLSFLPKTVVMTYDTEMKLTIVRGTNLGRVKLEQDQVEGKQVSDVVELLLQDIEGRPLIAQQFITETQANVLTTLQGKSRYNEYTTGEYYYLQYASPMFDEQGVVIGGILTHTDITSLKNAQKEVVEKNEFVEKIAATTPTGIYVYDLDIQKTVYYNEQLCNLLGYTTQEFVSLGNTVLATVVHPDEKVEIYERFVNVYPYINDGEISEAEYRIICKDGTVKYFHDRKTVFARNSDGAVTQLLGVVNEVTTHVQQTKEIEKMNSLLSETQRISGVGSWELQLSNQMVLATDEAFLAYGLDIPSDNIISREDLIECYHPEDKYRTNLAITKAISLQESFDIVCRVVSDCTVRYVRNIGTPITDNGGSVIGYKGTVQNVTKEKTALAEVQQLQKRLTLATNGVGIGIWEWNFGNDEVVWDEQTYNLFGTNKYNVPPNKVKNFWRRRVHPDDRRKVEGMFNASIQCGELETEYRIVLQDNETRYIQLKATVVFDEENTPLSMIGVNWDVTNERLALIEREYKERLLHETQVLTKTGGWELDITGYYYRCSDETFKLCGLETRPDGVIAREDFWKCVSEDEREANHTAFIEAMCNSTSYCENLHVNVNGEERILQATAHPIHDESGALLKYNGSIQDVTERVQHEEKINELSERLTLATNGIGFGIWEWMCTTQESIWDEQTYKLYDIDSTEKDHLHELWRSRVHPDDLHTTTKSLTDAVSDTGKLFVEYRVIHRDGSVHYLRENAVIIKDALGNTTRLIGISQDVTEQCTTEEKRRYMEELLNESQQLANIGSWEFLVDEGVAIWSDSTFRIFGLEKQQTVTMSQYMGCIHEDDRAILQNTIGRSIQDNNRYEIQHRIVRPNGQVRTLYCLGEPCTDAHGVVKSMRGTVQDITERKMAEDALFKTAERLQIASESGAFGIWDLDIGSGALDWDDQMYKIYGITTKEFKSTHSAWQKLLHHQDRELTCNKLNEILNDSTIKSFKLEFRILTPLRQIRYIKAHGTVLRNINDVAVRIIGLDWDVTKERIYEESIRRSEDLLNESQLIANIGSWDYNIITGEMHWSKQMYELFGLDSESSMLSFADYINAVHYDDRHDVYSTIDDAVQNGTSYAIEHRIFSNKGALHHVLSLGRPIGDDKGNVVRLSGTVQDITNNKIQQQELVIAKDKAVQASKAKSEFLANMSHEIRTPMNAVLGFTNLLSTHIQDPTLREYIKSIQAGGTALMQIINDVLDLSKVEAGMMTIRPEPTNIGDVVDDIGRLFSQKINEKELRFVSNISSSMPQTLMLDEVRIRQILFNLIGNAIKFTENGGVISVNVSCRMNSDNASRALSIVVSDTGIGIPRNQQELIFEAFRQVAGQSTRKFGGTGLGLSICKRLVNTMGGDITVESESGIGSSFIITLDNVLVSHSTTVVHTLSGKQIVFKPSSILVVDDNSENLKYMYALLQSHSFDVKLAQSGREALSITQDWTPDIVMMDLRMPEMDGYETRELLRRNERFAKIPIVAVSATVQEAKGDLVGNSAFEGYLLKPVTANDLIEELKKYLSYSETDEQTIDSSGEDSESTITEELTPEKMTKYREALHEVSQKQWQVAHDTFGSNDVEKFISALENVEKNFKTRAMSRYISKIRNAYEAFDIVNLKSELGKYTKIVEDVDKQIM